MTARPRLCIVVAVASNGVIGAEGDMPWKLSSDLKRFRRLTMGKPVVMGRRTLESIGRPLDGRTNIVLTRDPTYTAEGVVIAHDWPDALSRAEAAAAAGGASEIMVLGGGMLYAQALPFVDRLYVTHVDAAPDGDTRFPPIDPAIWRQVEAEDLPRGPKDTADARAVTYDRILPARIGT